MEPVELTQEQHLYLQFILDNFRADSRWPTHRQVDRFFYQADPDADIEEIWKSLPSGLTSYLDINLLDNLASLTLEGIYALESDAPEFALFLWVLDLCGKTYSVSEGDTVRSEDILRSHPQWSEAEVKKMGWLLLGEGNLWQSFGGPHPQSGSWTCTLQRKIRRFHDITTMDAYWKKRESLRLQPLASPPPGNVPISGDTLPDPSPISGVDTSTESSVLLQQMTIHPDIYMKCWSLYTQGNYDNAILAATRAVEVAVRRRARLPDDLVGVNLITQAFKPDNPMLVYSDLRAEQEGMMALLRGMILVYKNPQSHRHVEVQNKSECLAILLMCSNLLYVIDALRLREEGSNT
jgi:uncharacterized protein (TIGR02391 family)